MTWCRWPRCAFASFHFYWRFALARQEVPCEVEEMADDLREQGKLDEAEAIFRLLIECFDGYAEGHNYLGLIALERGDLDEAIEPFERTMHVGRRKLPRRIPKKDWWSRFDTRPYMRGLRNRCLALTQVGRYDEALERCDRLERTCGDAITAQSHRAAIYLNTGRWEEALAAANRLQELSPEENLVAALAAFELGRADEATRRFLHGAITHPRAAHMVLGLGTAPFQSPELEEVTDHNTGVVFRKVLRGFLASQSGASRRFFRTLLQRPEVQALLAERDAVTQRWLGPRDPEAEWRAAFDRMRSMATPAFARHEARALLANAAGTGLPDNEDGRDNGTTPRRTKTARRPPRSRERRA